MLDAQLQFGSRAEVFIVALHWDENADKHGSTPPACCVSSLNQMTLVSTAFYKEPIVFHNAGVRGLAQV